MRYSLRFRLLIAALAVLAGGAAPAVAVAHGVNHARDAAHETPEHHHHVPEHHAVPSAEHAFHRADGHGHPVLDVGATKRVGADVAVVVVAELKALPDALPTAMTLSRYGNERVTAPAATGPPPSLRAPPIL